MSLAAGKPIYLDVCALGRPYDDQSLMRVEMEATAVQLIIVHVRAGKYALYYSPVHVQEILDNPDGIAGGEILAMLQGVGRSIVPMVRTDAMERRGRALVAAGMGVADAFHVAHAEQAHAAFVTCDDRLIRKCRGLDIGVWFGTPVEFCIREGLV